VETGPSAVLSQGWPALHFALVANQKKNAQKRIGLSVREKGQRFPYRKTLFPQICMVSEIRPLNDFDVICGSVFEKPVSGEVRTSY
jgi:hypothetical protein